MLEPSQGKEAIVAAQLTVHLTMAQLVEGWPAAAPVLARRGMGCVGCTMARFETVGEAAAAYGFDPEELLTEIRRNSRSHTRSSRRSSS
jgi:hybrid cluster-associated redox disulfide protein